MQSPFYNLDDAIAAGNRAVSRGLATSFEVFEVANEIYSGVHYELVLTRPFNGDLSPFAEAA